MRATRRPAAVIVHQRDKRGDNEGCALARDGGKLVAERFARARGHHQQHVAAIGGGAADGLLIRAEGWMAEGGVQQLGEIGHRHAQFRMFFAVASSEIMVGTGSRMRRSI
jgi:hypothetical protein